MEYLQYLRKLEALDLSGYPTSNITSLINKIGLRGNSGIFIQPNHWIARGRLNETSKSYHRVSELSYKPAKFNNTYQRASTPNTTMFYGCIAPEAPQKNELDFIKYGVAAETTDLITNEIMDSEKQKITISYWRAVDLFMLVLVAKLSDIQNNLSQTHNSGSDKLYSIH